MKTKINILAILILTLLGMFSCNSNQLYDEYKKIENESWNLNNKLKFEFEVDDTVGFYNIFIAVRHTQDYPYNNLWLFVKSSAPNGRTALDTVEIILSDNRGKWLGSGLGDIYDLDFLWKKGVRFAIPGKYIVEYQQAMRIDDLMGIKKMGLRVEKIKQLD